MDRGAWRVIVHGVAKSRTRVKWVSEDSTAQHNIYITVKIKKRRLVATIYIIKTIYHLYCWAKHNAMFDFCFGFFKDNRLSCSLPIIMSLH